MAMGSLSGTLAGLTAAVEGTTMSELEEEEEAGSELNGAKERGAAITGTDCDSEAEEERKEAEAIEACPHVNVSGMTMMECKAGERDCSSSDLHLFLSC